MAKTLIITGASKGIGLATAGRFMEAGYRVVNLSRRRIELDGAEQLIVDLQNPLWLESCAEQLVEIALAASTLCVLHNAARHDGDSIGNLDAENFRQVLQVNMVAPQELNNLLVPYMRAGSSIIYMGSTLSEKAVPGCASYVASKHASIGMMRSTVQDLAGKGIHTVCVCPGFTDTVMLREHIGNDPDVVASITEMVSFGRLIEPREIAETLWFCAGNAVINGTVIHANLGQIER